MSFSNQFDTDNCMWSLRDPQERDIGHCFAYSYELNMVASRSLDGVRIWKAVREDDDDSSDDTSSDDDSDDDDNDDGKDEVIAIQINKDCITDLIFLPGCYLAVSYWNWNRSSSPPPNDGIIIYSVPSGDVVIDIGDYNNRLGSQMLAVTSANNLLVGRLDGCLVEFTIDFENKKVADKKVILKDLKEDINLLCCSRTNYKLCFQYETDVNFHYVELSPDGVITMEHITYCFINGEKREFGDTSIGGLVHDGENIIVATEDDIIALESGSEGSIGHIIVSSGIPALNNGSLGGMILNDNGHLMVCEWDMVIFVYEYYKRHAKTLQGLCRDCINNTLKWKSGKVTYLPIPKPLKNYLLYKV